jgi:hypothetical protein
MKQFYDSEARLVSLRHAPTLYDDLPFPRGLKINELSNVQIMGVLSARVPGISSSNGRLANLKIYGDYLNALRNRAADAAVAEWMSDV